MSEEKNNVSEILILGLVGLELLGPIIEAMLRGGQAQTETAEQVMARVRAKMTALGVKVEQTNAMLQAIIDAANSVPTVIPDITLDIPLRKE